MVVILSYVLYLYYPLSRGAWPLTLIHAKLAPLKVAPCSYMVTWPGQSAQGEGWYAEVLPGAQPLSCNCSWHFKGITA